MEFNKNQYSSILEALRASPRGMNVTEVAKVTGMNRATVAKYLEMLYVSGHADMRLFGTAKVYYISQRMPISAFLNFSSDLIIVLDRDSRVLNANDSFFEFTGTRRDDVVHKNINNFAFPLKFEPPIEAHIVAAMDGKGTTIESYYRKKDRGYYFNVKLIPLVFDEGDKGVTIIFEDITEKKLAEKALRDSNRELEKKVRERTQELLAANEALRKSAACLVEAEQIAHVGYWSLSLKTSIITASDETCRIFGLEPGSKWDYGVFRTKVHPDYIALVEKTDEEAIRQRKPIDYEYRIVLDDGSERIVHSVGEVRRDEAGDAVEIFGTLQDVTGRRQAEEALRDSEAKFKMLFEGSSTAIFIIDVKTRRIADCNTYASRLIGRPKKEIIGMHHTQLHPADRLEHCHDDSKLHSRDGPVLNFETEVLHRDGRRIPIFINSTVMDIGGRKVMIGSYLDITDIKRAEEALHKAEDKYRGLVENINDIAWEMDKDARFTYMSPRVRDIAGNGPENYLGRPILEFMPPEDLAGFVDGFKDYFINPRPFSLTRIRMFHRDGHVLELEINGSPTFDGKGEFCGYMGVSRDVTSRELAEKALRESEERYRRLIEDIQVQIWAVDENYRFTYMNPRSREVLGYEPGEMVGKTPLEFMAPEEAKRVQGILRPLLEARKPFEIAYYYVLRKDGGKVFFKTNAMPIFDDGGRFIGYRGVNRDITDG